MIKLLTLFVLSVVPANAGDNYTKFCMRYSGGKAISVPCGQAVPASDSNEPTQLGTDYNWGQYSDLDPNQNLTASTTGGDTNPPVIPGGHRDDDRRHERDRQDRDRRDRERRGRDIAERDHRESERRARHEAASRHAKASKVKSNNGNHYGWRNRVDSPVEVKGKPVTRPVNDEANFTSRADADAAARAQRDAVAAANRARDEQARADARAADNARRLVDKQDRLERRQQQDARRDSESKRKAVGNR